MPLNLRGTAAAILSLVTVSGAETAFAQKQAGFLGSTIGTVRWAPSTCQVGFSGMQAANNVGRGKEI
jgi:hypothetical protein